MYFILVKYTRPHICVCTEEGELAFLLFREKSCNEEVSYLQPQEKLLVKLEKGWLRGVQKVSCAHGPLKCSVAKSPK